MRTLVAVAAALALSACQDPAGVGLGLIDEEQSDPSARVVALADIDTLGFSVPAIGIASGASSNPRPQARVLVGSVQDAVFGDARAVAYVDAIRPTTADTLQAGSIRRVYLQMPRVYTYGDTTAALPVELRQVQGTWDAVTSYPPDTLFAVGEALATATVAQADSLVRFDLPASWVAANAATLAADDFVDAFEGFAVQAAPGFAPSPGVVFGLGTFDSAGAGLRVVTDADTVVFPLSEVFSSVATRAPTAVPDRLLPIRRNSGRELRFSADLSGFGALPLSRAILRLPLDVSLARVGTFVRPLATTSALYGVRGVGTDDVRYVPLGLVTVADGQAVLAETATLTRAFQALLIDPAAGGFDRYEIRPDLNPDFSPASLDVLPLVLPAPGDDRPPRFTLTLVGAPA